MLPFNLAVSRTKGVTSDSELRATQPGSAILNPRPFRLGSRSSMDMTLMVYYHLIRARPSDHDWRPKRLRTRGSLVKRHCSLELFEDCQTEFHPDYSALAFPTEFLSRRLPRQGSATKFDATEAWQFGPEDSEPITDALYRLVASRFPYRKLPTLDQLALLVELSPATLKRQLASAGMTYGKLLDRIRFDVACEMLSIPQYDCQGDRARTRLLWHE